MQRNGAALSDDNPLDRGDDLARAVLAGDYAGALKVCRSALVHPQIGTQRIYHGVLLPAIRNVGQAWADDSASFAETSLAFGMLHRILDRLTHDQAKLNGVDSGTQAFQEKIIVAVAPGDTHSFGARILTQELLLRGWSVTFFDHKQSEAVMAELARQSYAAIAVSVSCDESLAGLADFVITCRLANRNPQMEVLIGGAAIQPPFGQYCFLGADKVGLAIDDVSTYLSRKWIEKTSGNWN